LTTEGVFSTHISSPFFRKAERIREKVYHSFYPHYKITVSIGVVDSREGDEDIVGRADEAMYRAKRKGKNRVEVS